MKTSKESGILGYGAYIPKYIVEGEEIARVWGNSKSPIKSKRVPGLDEDTLTMAYEASNIAISSSGVNPENIQSILLGSESKTYAVKPTGTILSEILGIAPTTMAADYEFACKAGTEALQVTLGLVSSGMVEMGLAIGCDCAQGRPGDELEYTVGAGGAAFILSRKSKDTIAYFESSYSYVTDTPDFWRRQGEKFPSHLSRFTGYPSYFYHTSNSVKGLFKETGYKSSDFDHVVFHQPNEVFPRRIAKILGFTNEQIETGLLTPLIGNAYAGSSLLGLAAVLDVAKPGEKILLCSYGSGAGSDSFIIIVQDKITEKRSKIPILSLIKKSIKIDYALYARHRELM